MLGVDYYSNPGLEIFLLIENIHCYIIYFDVFLTKIFKKLHF